MKKHYARRMPQISHSFGLFENKLLVGICAFGVPACQANSSLGKYPMVELVRLVVETKKKNASSILISGSFKLLPKPIAIISYADKSVNHIGYIYQATNWIYTGISSGDVEYVIDGKHTHRKNAYNQFGTGSKTSIEKMGHIVDSIKQGDKHRYCYFLGSKKQKKEMLKALKYPILPYPKGESKRYDTSAEFPTQIRIF